MNADSFSVAQRLWKNDAVRSAVVAQANAAVSKGGTACGNGSAKPSPQDAAKCLEKVKQLGIPLGWSKDTSPSGWGIPGKMLGLLLTAFAILLGAPFWFDLLGKVSQLRGAGPPSGGATSAPAPAVQITMAKDAGATIDKDKDAGATTEEKKSP